MVLPSFATDLQHFLEAFHMTQFLMSVFSCVSQELCPVDEASDWQYC